MTADEIAAALNVAPSAIRIVEPDRFYKGRICIAMMLSEPSPPSRSPAMTKDELVEKCARALAHSHGLDFDEVCGVDADPDHGYCDSGTCIASGYEDHDAAYARACYLSDARAALAIAMPAAFEMAAEVAEKRAEARFADFGTTEPDTNASYYSGRRGEALDELDEEDGDIAKALRELGEKWK